MPPDRVASRRRVAHSLTLLYRAIVDHANIPALPAYDAEIRDDLTAAATAAARSLKMPADHHYAACLTAMLHNHRPCVEEHRGSTPMVVACHEINQARRVKQKGLIQ